MPQAIIIAALGTNAGKTLIAAALMRLLREKGRKVRGFKVGPDYIDPGFHQVASGHDCANLDLWAMRPDTIAGVLQQFSKGQDYIIIEGVMGLFDGAVDGTGSTADLAADLNLPIILVADAQGQGPSLAAAIKGFLEFRLGLNFQGIILNSVASERHQRILSDACANLSVPVLGYLPRVADLRLANRHLGLVQAAETEALDDLLHQATGWLADNVDVDGLLQSTQDVVVRDAGTHAGTAPGIPPLGQRIAVARDIAFSFCYPHLLAAWRAAGAELSFFSPLADEFPHAGVDAVYLPGGYPELYAGQLAAAENFKTGMRQAAATGALVFGECGGYMTLGEGLIDREGDNHEMLGLLPLTTSFAKPKLHLGYRILKAITPDAFLGQAGFRGHEFHYATTISTGGGSPLFQAFDGYRDPLGAVGLRQNRVLGSFMHLIDVA
jgi:cobyrinic acid a,c-diamide synthase